MGPLQRPEHRSPGHELLAPELWEEPLTPEERRPRGERRGAGGSAFAHWGPLPPKEDALTPVSAHHGPRRSHVAGAGPHPARPQALSTLMEDVSLIVHALRLWCEQ